MNTAEVRTAFLEFFESKGHSILPSSSLVPGDDPTLLFNNAGMNQFKNNFLGIDKKYKRATTAQKCMRISGKHNDLENVGVTARHHTFFEMMGNFSFGDYFKQEVIAYAWEFVTEVLKLDRSKLWVTIFEEDDEAGELWKAIGVEPSRILKCGADDNFWSMGETGPCGPCSELHYYIGDQPEKQSEADFRKDDGTYLEFWNLVFMQFDRNAAGELTPLPKPSIDTGLGLERVVSILNGYPSNYETDSLRGVITTCEEISSKKYQGMQQEPASTAMRVIADHSRAVAFLIADGVTPSSEGRGYVLRRLIRRAVRHAKFLSQDLYLPQTTLKVVELMGAAYPELKKSKDLIQKISEAEESKFNETIDSGLEYLEKETQHLNAGDELSGEVAFLLHDTYGFPLDLTEDVLKSRKISVNHAEFNKAMSAQKERSREDRKAQKIEFSSTNLDIIPTEFIGYDELSTETPLLHAISNSDGTYSLFFAASPFYAESGGQIGDKGEIAISDLVFNVQDTQKLAGQFIAHQVELAEGIYSDALIGETAQLHVAADRRAQIRKHHSATHIVHAALRKFLGTHVKQAGSRVADNSLRFDYSHFESVSDEVLSEIGDWVNQEIQNNYSVETKLMSLKEARATGAMALFGEKYSDQVRVVEIGPNSLELCGGTHVQSSGEIGSLIISSESSIATGTRRIECLVGKSATDYTLDLVRERKQLAALLKSEKEIVQKVEHAKEQLKLAEKEVERLKAQLAASGVDDLIKNKISSPSGVSIVKSIVNDVDNKTLKDLVDQLRVKIQTGVVVLAATNNGQATIVAGVTSDLKDNIHAGKIISSAAKEFGGKGGGRPDFAQAGGIASEQLDAALNRIVELVA